MGVCLLLNDVSDVLMDEDFYYSGDIGVVLEREWVRESDMLTRRDRRSISFMIDCSV